LQDEDEEMLVALEMAVRDRENAWTTSHELSATAAELTHALLLTTLRVNGAKRVGDVMHFPRPWDKKADKVETITMGQFVQKVKGGRHA
jgi:hypothetical protein